MEKQPKKKHLAVFSLAGFIVKVSEVIENKGRVFVGGRVGNTDVNSFLGKDQWQVD